MGIFKSIKKAFKKIVKGVKKVFKKVGQFVGKIMSSKIGKILMIGLTVFTLGTALMAGAGAFAGSTAPTLFGKVVAGGKEFALALVGKGGAKAAEVGANAANTAGAAGAFGTPTAATTVSTGAGAFGGPGTAATGVQAAGGSTGVLSKAAQMAKNVASIGADAASGLAGGAWNAASELAGGAWNALKSPTGMMIAGQAATGYANARMAAEAEQARLDQEVADNASWTDNAPGVIDANTIAKPLDPRRFNPNFVAPQEQSPMMVG